MKRKNLLAALAVAGLWILLLLAACQPLPKTAAPAKTTQPGSNAEASSTPPASGVAETRRPVLSPTTDVFTITILYDNNHDDVRLRTAWGFAALVETEKNRLLFDTGGDGSTLLHNMTVLGIDPTSIDAVVLSHIHDDHTGGLVALTKAGARPTVFLPPSFPADFKRRVRQATAAVEVVPGQSLVDGIFTTGELGVGIREQALVIRTGQGLVIVTGCAHPGIVEMVARADELFAEPVHLVIGGFHLGNKSENEVADILADFRRLGVMRVAPCHCTGERAIAQFAAGYGPDFTATGAGSVIIVGK